jgi:hypothetical protein
MRIKYFHLKSLPFYVCIAGTALLVGRGIEQVAKPHNSTNQTSLVRVDKAIQRDYEEAIRSIRKEHNLPKALSTYTGQLGLSIIILLVVCGFLDWQAERNANK